MIQKLPSEQLLFRNCLTATLTLQCYSLLIHNSYTGKWGTTSFMITGDSGASTYLGMTNGTVTTPVHRDFIKVTLTDKKVTFAVVSLSCSSEQL
jgi:hypothetical protein